MLWGHPGGRIGALRKEGERRWRTPLAPSPPSPGAVPLSPLHDASATVHVGDSDAAVPLALPQVQSCREEIAQLQEEARQAKASSAFVFFKDQMTATTVAQAVLHAEVASRGAKHATCDIYMCVCIELYVYR